MKIEENYPKYKLQIEPEDITAMGEPIGECDLTKEPVFIDYSKMDCEPPKEEDAWKQIADTFGLDRRYVKANMINNLMTWAKLRDFIDTCCPDFVEVSSIEIHNYDSYNIHDDSYNIHVEWTDSGHLIVSDRSRYGRTRDKYTTNKNRKVPN